MKTEKEIQDDEIRVIGDGETPKPVRHRWRMWMGVGVGIVVLFFIVLLVLFQGRSEPQDESAYFDPQPEIAESAPTSVKQLGRAADSRSQGFIEIRDTVINDIPLRIFIPHHADMTLRVGALDRQDTTIVFAAQAADIRRDNKKIVGAFVLQGEPLAWGISKRGYCAIIEDKITLGVADNTPLFEEATEKGGYFFRQYPLVDQGRLVENEPKNKSIRRALCDRGGEIMMVESQSSESFHDFAQALVDLKVTNAIYLVGSTAFGWAVDENRNRVEFGVPNNRLPENVSYIVWKRKV